ncbi:hypothetical protein Plhal304r1_c061g0148631 [Plasmopara halstedii]
MVASHASICVCVHDGCCAIKSEQHIFFDCSRASRLWSEVLRLVSPYFAARPTWLNIAFGWKLRRLAKMLSAMYGTFSEQCLESIKPNQGRPEESSAFVTPCENHRLCFP